MISEFIYLSACGRELYEAHQNTFHSTMSKAQGRLVVTSALTCSLRLSFFFRLARHAFRCQNTYCKYLKSDVSVCLMLRSIDVTSLPSSRAVSRCLSVGTQRAAVVVRMECTGIVQRERNLAVIWFAEKNA